MSPEITRTPAPWLMPKDGAFKLALFKQDVARDPVLDIDFAELAALAQGVTDDLIEVVKAHLRLDGRRLTGEKPAQHGRGGGQRQRPP